MRTDARSTYPRRSRLVGVVAALLLLAAPVPAAQAAGGAEEAGPATPVTVPALSDWAPESGQYVYGRGTRLVADGKAERRVADTLADDLRAAGHGSVPVVGGERVRETSLSMSRRSGPRWARGTNSARANACR